MVFCFGSVNAQFRGQRDRERASLHVLGCDLRAQRSRVSLRSLLADVDCFHIVQRITTSFRPFTPLELCKKICAPCLKIFSILVGSLGFTSRWLWRLVWSPPVPPFARCSSITALRLHKASSGASGPDIWSISVGRIIWQMAPCSSSSDGLLSGQILDAEKSP